MILNFFVSFPHRRLLATLVKTRLITITWIRFRQTVCWFGWIKPVPLVIATSMWRWVANPTLCMRTQAHARMHIYTQAHKHTSTCAHAHAHKHMHARTHAYAHNTSTQAYSHNTSTYNRLFLASAHATLHYYRIKSQTNSPLFFFWFFFHLSAEWSQPHAHSVWLSRY